MLLVLQFIFYIFLYNSKKSRDAELSLPTKVSQADVVISLLGDDVVANKSVYLWKDPNRCFYKTFPVFSFCCPNVLLHLIRSD